MQKIRLARAVWEFDSTSPLGKAGGFGAVFVGSDSHGKRVAVKRLHLSAAAAAHRELRMAEDLSNRSLMNVMEVLDAGKDPDTDEYFVIMPVAERSLQDVIDQGGAVPEQLAIQVLAEIVHGLEEIPNIVHRDLKPANVLLLDGRWQVADFGIAKFVEESTSEKTLRGCLSPQFAAPEQWRSERSTHATDIYALGCIAYSLLVGAPPFDGSKSELQEKHLSAPPPEIGGCSGQMRTLIAMMLRKPPDARPSLERVRVLLDGIRHHGGVAAESAVLSRLADAAAAHESEEAKTLAKREETTRIALHRASLARSARDILIHIVDEVERRVKLGAPNAIVVDEISYREIRVGTGILTFFFPDPNRVISRVDFPQSHWDVISGAHIQATEKSGHRRQASLWYTRKADETEAYRWYEVGYETNPIMGPGQEFQPFALGAKEADAAHSSAMDVVQASYQPVPIDDEDTDDFCERWIHILSEACKGRLSQMPTGLPHC